MKYKSNLILLAVMIFLSLLFFKNVIFSNKMLYGTDWLSGSYMQRSFFENSIKVDKQIPLWNPNQFAGIPTGEGFFGEIFHPLTLPWKYILPTYRVWTLIFFIHMIIAGFGMYLYLKRKTSLKLTAGVFSLVYMFTSSMLSEVYGGHDGRFMVISYLPILIYFIDRALEKLELKWFLFASIPASLMLLTGHIQSSYYAMVFSLFYIAFNHININYKHNLRNYSFAVSILTGFLFSLVNQYLGFAVFLLITFAFPILLDKRLHPDSVKIYSYAALFIFTAFLLSAVQYLPIFRFLPLAARGIERDYAYATSWSMGFPDIFDQFVSGFAGLNLNSINTYWGENPFKLHSTYIGSIPMILALAMLFTKKKNAAVLFFSVSIITVFILALGGNTPLYRIFYFIFPYVNKFRAPELIFFIGSFSAVVLAAMLFNEKDNKALIYTASTVGIFSVILLIFPQLVIDIFRSSAGQKYNALLDAVKASAPSAFKTLLFAVIAYFSYKFINSKYSTYIFCALGILMVGDLWINNSKFVIAIDPPETYFAEDNVVRALSRDREKYRVFSFGYRNDDYLTLHGFEIISGNHPSPFAEYQEFLNNQESVIFNPEKVFMVPNRMKYLNVKYSIVPFIPSDTAGYDDRSKNIILYYKNLYDTMKFKEIGRVDNYAIMSQVNYLPRAFCIDSYIIEENFDSVLNIIDSDENCGNFYAIFNKDPGLKKDSTPLESKVTIVKYSPNRVEVTVDSNKESMLILLDQNYKGWRCSVNGLTVNIYKAFGIFRGVKIDKGENRIVFWFDSTLQIVSAFISILALAFILGFALIKKN